MALFLELADYALNQLTSVPEEISYTSRLRQWGIAGDSSAVKVLVMNTVVQKKNLLKRESVHYI